MRITYLKEDNISSELRINPKAKLNHYLSHGVDKKFTRMLVHLESGKYFEFEIRTSKHFDNRININTTFENLFSKKDIEREEKLRLNYY